MTQQELAKLIIDSVNVWALALFALIGVLSPAVGLLTSGAIAAGWLSADSGWARFAAKVFSVTLQAKSNSLPEPNAKDVKKALNGLLFVGLLFAASGCSLEAARAKRVNSPASLASPAPRAVTQCEAWDSMHVWGDWTAGVGAGVSATATGLAAASDPGDFRNVVTGVAIGAGVVSGVALILADQSASKWAERCGQ